MRLTIEQLAEVDRLLNAGLNLQAYSAATQIAPLDAWEGTDAVLLAAQLSSQLGSESKCRTFVRRAWRGDRTHAGAQFYRASDLIEQRGPVAGLAFFRRQNPVFDGGAVITAWWHALQAQMYALLRDFKSAEHYLAKAFEAKPDDAWIRAGRAYVLELQDRYDDALDAAREGYSLDPQRRSVIAYFVHLLLLTEQSDEAMKVLTKASGEIESGRTVVQLADLQSEIGDYSAAYQSLLRVRDLTPLRDAEFQKMLDLKLSDAAYMVGDIPAAIEFAEQSGEPFQKKVGERLRNLKGDERRVVLKTGFLRQHNVTCAPATIANISRFWGRDERHLEIAEEICYDGTPNFKGRDWAVANGWTVSEFTFNWADLVALIDRGIPFTLATTFPGSGHMQAVVGYDQKRGTALIRDPYVPNLLEFDAEALIESQRSTGPGCMAMVPSERAELLEGIGLAEHEAYDFAHRVVTAINNHDRSLATSVVAAAEERFPDHRLTLSSQWEIARYDSNGPRVFELIEKLREKFPADVNLKLAYLGTAPDFKNVEERRSELRRFATDENSDPMIWLQYGEDLATDARQHDRALRWLWRAIRRLQSNGAALRAVANILWVRRDLDRAFELYRLAACLSDKDENLSYVYFLAARHLGREDEAIAFLSDRFERFGHLSAFPSRTLFQALREMSRTVEALGVLERAAEKRPDDGQLQLFIASAMMRIGRTEDADKYLQKADGKVAQSEWLREAAQFRLIAGDLEGARVFLHRITEKNPMDHEVHSSIAFIISALEGNQAARDYVAGLVRTYPFNRDLKMLMLRYLKDDPADELEVLRELIELNPNDVAAHRLLSDCLLKIGDHQQAKDAASLAVEIDPSDPEAHVSLGKAHQKSGNTAEAIASFERSYRISVDCADALDQRLTLCQSADEKREVLADYYSELQRQMTIGIGLERYLEAAKRVTDRFALLDRLREYRDRNESSWFATSALVQLLTDLRRFDEALEIAVENTERFPLNSNVWYDLAVVQRLRGDSNAEIKALGEAIAISPMWGWAAQTLADAYIRTSRLEAAETLITETLSRLPLDNFLHGNLANIQWKLGRRDEAIESAIRAVAIDPSYEWAWQVIVSWGDELGTPELAAELARDLTRRKPKDANVWIQLAKVVGGNTWSEEELAAAETALSIEPGNERALAIKAGSLAKARRFDEALAVCQFRTHDGRRPDVLRFVESRIEFDRGNPGTATQILETLGRDVPDYFPAFARLAEIYSTNPEKTYDYLRVTKEMTRLAPQDSLTFGYYGEALLLVGKQKEARSALSQALTIAPDYTFAGVSLFFTALEVGDTDEASKALETLETFNPDVQCLRMRLALAAHLKDIESIRSAWAKLCCDKDANLSILFDGFERIEAAGFGDDEEIKSTSRSAAFEPDASPDAGGLMVAVQIRRGRYSDAMAELARFEPNPQLWENAASCLIEELGIRNPEAAFDYIRNHQDKLAVANKTWQTAGFVLQNVAQPFEAARWYQGWEKRDNLPAFVYWNIFLSEINCGMRERAFTVCRHGIKASPDGSTVLLRLILGIEAVQKDEPNVAHDHLSEVDPLQLNEWQTDVYRAASVILEMLEADRPENDQISVRVSELMNNIVSRREYKRALLIRELVDPMFECIGKRCSPLQRIWIKTRLFFSRYVF